MGDSEAGRALARKRWDNATPEDRERQAAILRRHTRSTRKLTMAQAAEIRKRVAAGEARKQMVQEYGISRSTVGLIVRGVIYTEK